jgi:uncharacterized protein
MKKLEFIISYVALTLAICTVFSPQSIHAKEASELNKLGEDMAAQISTQDEIGKIQMKVIESDGTSKTRDMSYSRLNDQNSHYTMIRMISPKDIRGTSLLSIIKNGQEEKWVYLPSSKATRKISTSGEGGSRILDSELYAEDFDLGVLKSATSKIKKKESDGTVIIETKIANPKSSYGKTTSWVGKNNLLKRAEVYDKKNALLKQVEFSDYMEVGTGKWRAGQISILNVQNKRKTELIFKDIKVNQGLKPIRFTTRALGEGA